MGDETATHEQNVAYYDTESTKYDKIRYSSKRGIRADILHKKIIDSLLCSELATQSSILEVGCGTGRLIGPLADKGFHVTGIDVSKGMLDVAKSKLTEHGEQVKLIHFDGGAMPFDDNTFDAAYSILVINLIPTFVETFREVARVLKPGGTFVFSVPNLVSVFMPAGLYVNLRGKTRTANESGHRYSHWFAPSEYRQALQQCGFKVDRVLGEPAHARLVDNCTPTNAAGLGLLWSRSVYVQAKLEG